MSTTETQQVFEHHGSALMSRDIDEVMKDYTEDSVMITNLSGVTKGLVGIRAVFEAPSDLSGIQLLASHFESDVAYITWKADGIPFGTDTFIVRDGKILVQTVAFHIA